MSVMRWSHRFGPWVACALALAGCRGGSSSGGSPSAAASGTPQASAAPRASAEVEPGNAGRPEFKWYGWLEDPSEPLGVPSELLYDRVKVPKGLSHDRVDIDSAGEWLRFLPVYPVGTPVKQGNGEILLRWDDSSVAAVVQMDVGHHGCRLSSIGLSYRLHAEWAWSRGERRVNYRTSGDDDLPLTLWARGQRPQVRGSKVYFSQEAPAKRQLVHADLREYIEGILPYLDVGAVLKHSRALAPGEVGPGDLFVHSGAPGEAVVVLDAASNPKEGKRAFLLGRILDPCSNFFVLRATSESPWFFVDGKTPVKVPQMKPFDWSEARRLRTYGYNPDR